MHQPPPTSGSEERSISVLVVTWNNETTLPDCLTALRQELPAGGEILCFDNHSVDGSRAIAESYGARVEASDSNVGFAAGMNRLATTARGEVLVLLNPDVFLHSGALRTMLQHFSTEDEHKIVGGLLLGADGKPELTSARLFPTAWSVISWLLSRRRSTRPLPMASQEVEAVSGAFFATTRTLWRQVAGFDEAYRHSWEDLDFFWRASGTGATVWFEPGAAATHLGGASVRQAPLAIDALRLGGALRFVRKRQGALAAAFLRTALLFRSLTALALDVLHIHRLDGPRRTRALALLRLALSGEGGRRLQLPVEPE
jgi:N-acetylglucosaminyl-diphospho-decaprenol L-rhamnosyltransferase